MPTSERTVRYLRIHAVLSSSVLLILLFVAATPANPRFAEIDVERINIVEKDGNLRMVISNKERSPGPIMYGKPFGYPGGGRPGMIFYNDEETENGGLIFSGATHEDGTHHSAGSLTFDQYNQDQVVALQHIDENGQRFHGLSISDRPEGRIDEYVARRDAVEAMPEGAEKEAAKRMLEAEPQPAPRLFVGRARSRNSVINMYDESGKSRLRFIVEAGGTARIDFLDDDGKVVRRITADEPAPAGDGSLR